MNATRLQPAALAFPRNAGIGSELTIAPAEYGLVDFLNQSGDPRFVFQISGFGYEYQKRGEEASHTIGFSSRILPGLYTGTATSFFTGSQRPGESLFTTLVRPATSVSIGAGVLFNPEEVLDFRLGLGLRPLTAFGMRDELLTFSADGSLPGSLSTSFDGDSLMSALAAPVLELSSAPIPGLMLAGRYDVQDAVGGVSLAWNLGPVSSYASANTSSLSSGAEIAGVRAGVFTRFIPEPALQLAPRGRIVRISEVPPIVEELGATSLGPINLPNAGITLSAFTAEMRRIAEDDSIGGVLFDGVNFNASFASILEIERALHALRDAGKQIIFYFENASELSYVLAASSADLIVMHPLGQLNLVGPSAGSPYLAAFLEELGITFHDFASHDYKTANNIFAQSDMPEEEREALMAILEDFIVEEQRMITAGREDELTVAVTEAFDQGPYLIPADAQEIGLLDEVATENELAQLIAEYLGERPVQDYLFPRVADTAWAEDSGPEIALIQAVGSIATGQGVPGAIIGSETTARAIREARENPRTRAILLRIDSGGGSALASDIIADEVRLATEAGIPVVASMAGTAASGGYYIAAYADHIIAEPVTVTGSIGVAAGTFDVADLLEELDIGWETVTAAENSDFLSSVRPPTDEEREQLENYVNHTYDRFLEVVAAGRDMSRDEVHAIAQGRIWSGQDALERGLVDELGGLRAAEDALRRLADLEGPLQYRSYDGQGLSIGLGPELAARIPGIEGLRGLADLKTLVRALSEHGPQARLHWTIGY